MTTNTGRPASYRLRAFAFEYLKDGNATRAAKRVGYSAKAAAQQGHVLLRNPKVQKIIARKLKDADATAECVLLELRRLATADLTDIHPGGKPEAVLHLESCPAGGALRV